MASLRTILPLLLCTGLVCIVSCTAKSREELIIGTWAIDKSNTDGKTKGDIEITFYKDLSLVSRVSADGKNYVKDEGTYKFKHDGKYITVFMPTNQHTRDLEIVEISNNTLKLHSDEDSVIIALKRIH